MSHGPNFVAISHIKSPSTIPAYQQPSTNNNLQQLQRILQNNRQFQSVMKHLRLQFDHLGSTSTHITQFYPQFITDYHYVQDYEKTVIYDEGMADLMFKLEKENQELKLELKVWMQQFGKKASLMGLLVKANKALQEQIVRQDRDLIRVIDGLGGMETEELKGLQEKMEELRVENGLAVQHLGQLQEEIQGKKGYLVESDNGLEEQKLVLDEVRGRFAEAAEEQDHQTKMYAMVKTIVDNLSIDISELGSQEGQLEKDNETLKVDKTELSYHLNYNKDEIGDMQSTVINENNDKTHEEKLLRRSVNSLEEKMRFDDERINKLQNELAREERMVQHYVKAFNDSDIKLKNSTQYYKSIEANLTKQLEKETQRGSDVLTLKYQIGILEGDLQLVKSQRKQQEVQFPERVNRIGTDFEVERRKLEKQLQQLGLQHTRSLMNLNNEIVRYKAELERSQRDLQEKNDDLKDVKSQQIEIKNMKASIRELGVVLRQKAAQVNAMQ